MKIKIVKILNGNEFLNLLRKCNKEVAQELRNSAHVHDIADSDTDRINLFWKGCNEIIELKKR